MNEPKNTGKDLHVGISDRGIIGLTPHLGSEFVHYARSDTLWNAAVQRVTDTGMGLALSKMFETLQQLPTG